MAKLRIGDMLVQSGLIDDMQLNAALAHQRQWGGQLGDALVEMGFLDEIMLWKALSRQLRIPLISIPATDVQRSAIALVPQEVASKHEVFPIHDDGKVMTLAMSNPSNVEAIDDIRFRTGHRIKPVIAPQREILWAIGHFFMGDPRPCPEPRKRRQLVASDEEFVLIRDDRGQSSETVIPTGVNPSVATEPAAPNLNERQLNQEIRNVTNVGTPAGELGVPSLELGHPTLAAINPMDAATIRAELDDQTRSLRVLIEACIRRGYFTRDDYLTKLRSLDPNV